MATIDKEFQELCKKILIEGKEYEDKRREVKRLQIPSYTFRHEFKDGFPAITNKKLYWRGIVGELIWFLRGDNDVKFLNDNKIAIWNKDAYNWHKKTAKEVLSEEEFYKLGHGSVGQNYSVQWRNFNGQTDQIKDLIDEMRKNIMSSRLKVNAWNPCEVDLTALPPCFTEDVLVCTEKGYKKISDISINDTVLTKEGDFKTVNDVMVTEYNGSLIGIKRRGDTDMMKCTPNHKFFLKNKGFVQSLFVEEGDFIGIPRNKNEIIPKIEFVKSKNQFKSTTKKHKIDMNNPDVWWMMGYFLGDGWIRKDRKDISFAISHKEYDIVMPRLKKVFKNLIKGNQSGKSNRYTTTSVEYHHLLSLFGSGAINKIIPSFVIDAPKKFIKEFLDGYRMADGTKTKYEMEFGTISSSIAYGCQLLLSKLGIPSSISTSKKRSQHKIEGRIVNQSEKYYIIRQYSDSTNNDIEVDDDFIWFKVIDKFIFKNIEVNVYNLSVQKSHTYTANNIATKNCHSEFQVIGVPIEDGKFGFELHWNQRSVDTFLGLPFNIASYGLLAKIIESITGFKALAIEGTLKCVHFYDNQYEAAKTLLERNPDTHPNCELELRLTDKKTADGSYRSIDDIFNEYQIKDFKLIGYTSDEEIKVDMLAPKE